MQRVRGLRTVRPQQRQRDVVPVLGLRRAGLKMRADTAGMLTDRDRELFKGRNLGHFATLMPDGSPHVAPVWIDIEDGSGLILVNTALGRVKSRNVEREPRVGISVHDNGNIYRMVAVRGRVVEVTRDGAEEHI